MTTGRCKNALNVKTKTFLKMEAQQVYQLKLLVLDAELL